MFIDSQMRHTIMSCAVISGQKVNLISNSNNNSAKIDLFHIYSYIQFIWWTSGGTILAMQAKGSRRV